MTNVLATNLDTAAASLVNERFVNLADATRRRAREDADRVVARDLDGTVELTWGEALRRIEAFACGLHRLGVRRGDTVALMVKNRPELLIADLAGLSLGATVFSVYSSLPPVQMQPILDNSGARVIVCENAFLDQVLGARQLVPALEHVIVLEGGGPEGTTDWSQVEGEIDPHLDFDALASEIEPDDIATLIYTSGTTGPPKGVELTHRNIAAGASANNAVFLVQHRERMVCWLPTAHLADRMGGIYWPVLVGTEVTYVPDITRILEALVKVRPHLWLSMPRMLEKIRVAMLAVLEALPDGERAPALDALDAGLESVRLELAGEPVPPDLTAKLAEAEETVFQPLRTKFGLDRAHSVLSGGAPMPPHVAEFFFAIGVPLGEVYGASETGTAGTATPKGKRYRSGSLGIPEPGVEVQISDDGEILIRHEAVTRGYRGDPEASAAAFTEDRFLRTGDLGRWGEDGQLRLIGRKKELIINSHGKNMSPNNIEEAIKRAGSLVGEVCVIGDGRPYNVGLIVLDAETAPAWAVKEGLGEGLTLEELAREPHVQRAVQQQVDAGNRNLSRVEQIRRFHIVPGDWLPSGDELTPSMKLKRKVIADKYAAEIEALYARPKP